jgi:ribonuclease HII
LAKGQRLIAGVDEAGRGCLAGPVVAGAVIITQKPPKGLLADSKTLSKKQREEAFLWISEKCIMSSGESSASEIDEYGIKKATHFAMLRAIEKLIIQPDLLRVDGRDHFEFPIKSEEYIRGDSLFAEISAAGIVAKVTRDKKMELLEKQFPHFGFARHKGYGTAFHMEAIANHGPCDFHRKSFKPLSMLNVGG